MSNPQGDSVVHTLMRGTFPVTDLQQLVYLVKALCPEVSHLGEFRDWDRVYNAAPEAKAPKHSIRLRKHLGMAPAAAREAWEAYSLMYLGIVDRRVPAPVEKRPVTTVAIGLEAPQVLAAMGATLQYEYLRRGVRFRARSGLVVEVYVVEKLANAGNPNQSVALIPSDQHAVVDVVSDKGASPAELAAFMQHLQPIVMLREPAARRG